MSYAKCPRCGEYSFEALACNCKRFGGYLADSDPDDMLVIYAADARCAAERFAKVYDAVDSDYTIIRDGGANVIITDMAGNSTRYYVEAYSNPVYSAREEE